MTLEIHAQPNSTLNPDCYVPIRSYNARGSARENRIPGVQSEAGVVHTLGDRQHVFRNTVHPIKHHTLMSWMD